MKKEELSKKEKQRTRAKTKQAVSKGIIKKLPCEVCGEIKVDCHHRINQNKDMSWDTKRSNLYKELNPSFWDQLLENPKFGEFVALLVSGLVLAGLIAWFISI